MNAAFYFDHLYPLQDQVLQIISGINTQFHLTGGTALSRGYLHHRFSDDLDFFVNDDDHFILWGDRLIQGLSHSDQWKCQIIQREERFVRLNINQMEINLKIDLVNDVPGRIGTPWQHPILGRIDTAENILANKVTAVIDRAAPKDLADIWGLCLRMNLSLEDAIVGAQGKAIGIFPVDLSRVLCSVSRTDWELVRWIEAPDLNQFLLDLNDLGKQLIFPG